MELTTREGCWQIWVCPERKIVSSERQYRYQ